MTKIILQEETTGCGFACVAMLADCSYQHVKKLANQQGINASDEKLFTTTDYVRKLLSDLNTSLGQHEVAFTSWDELPRLALLATKHRIENDKPRWHWCVYSANPARVLDPASYLDVNERTDFDDIDVQWYIPVDEPQQPAGKTSR